VAAADERATAVAAAAIVFVNVWVFMEDSLVWTLSDR